MLGLVAEASTAAHASCLRETLETTGEGLGTCLPRESSGLRPWPPAQVLALTQGNSRWELSVCFPNKLKFIYFLKALQREGSISWFTPPHGHSIQSWARWFLAGLPGGVPGTPSPWAVFCCFPGWATGTG